MWIRGRLYYAKGECSLYKYIKNQASTDDDDILEIIPEYSIVMYVEPNPENNYEAKIIYKDIIGYIHTSVLGEFISTENLNHAESKETS